MLLQYQNKIKLLSWCVFRAYSLDIKRGEKTQTLKTLRKNIINNSYYIRYSFKDRNLLKTRETWENICLEKS